MAVALDTKGPEIRTGFTTEHKSVSLKKGSIVEISIQLCLSLATDYNVPATSEVIACSYKSLPKSVKPGS